MPWKTRRKSLSPQADHFEARDALHGADEISQRYSQVVPEVDSATQLTDHPSADDDKSTEQVPHTALCVQPRDGRVWVFLPPLTHLDHWVDLIGALEATAKETKIAIELEGYPPPSDERLQKLAVTPDPGVIEVNIQPAQNWQELLGLTEVLYEQARLNRLGTEKFMLDGRHIGTGGGNHVTLGAARAEDSPFLRRPDLLASMLVYWQNHPSLSYLFSGLFIGPTSQAPRIDEARDDAIYELEIALQQLAQQQQVPAWHVDRLFRNLLVDITGNTHRSEFCIDKLYSPAGPMGRLGLVELRAFEMPPHWQMSAVQMLLLRTLIAHFWREPYVARPARWGSALHDRFLLPHYIEQDFLQIVNDLQQAGFAFDSRWMGPFHEFRFPRYGEIHHQGIDLILRGAIEPWHVLGEEVTSQGTARFVDSSVERLQVTVQNFNRERYSVTCNGRVLPLQNTETEGVYVAGVRFKAWQPVFGLHPLVAADAPLVFDLVDNANQKSIGGCTYHVAHPSGRNYETRPVNAYEAQARRMARFWEHGHSSGTLQVQPELPNPNFPCTLDLRYQNAN